jgi:hypothetical protein
MAGGTGTDRIDVPLGFDVPDDWEPVDPTSAGVPGLVFVAVRRGVPANAGFTPNITMGVTRRTDDVTVTELADEAIGRLAATGIELSMLERDLLAEQSAPCVTQLLRLRTDAAPGVVVQSQVHLLIPLGDTPTDRLAVEMACSCKPDQLAAVTGDFQQFVASFHIRADGEGNPDAAAH